jgi:hypothetical protein
MRRLVLAMLIAAALFLSSASAASATIHPIMLGWVCGAASGNPPGQTPELTHADQSTLRALQFSKSSRGHRGSSAFDGVPVLGAVKVVQPWGAPS